MNDINRQVCLVTGATSGLGRAVASSLNKLGWTVIILARDRDRAEAALAEMRQAGPSMAELLLADLSDLATVRRAAAELTGRHGHLHLLVNCAAVYLSRREVTPDGLEKMFATNHLGPFLLTNLLLERMRGAGSARILTVTAPSTVRPDFDDLQGKRRFRSLNAFGATKMANLLFTFALARRLEGSGATANAVHPGIVRTGLMHQAPAPMRWITGLVGASAERAVEPILQVATEASFTSRNGRFFHKAKEISPPAYALDLQAQERLWQESVRLTGLPG